MSAGASTVALHAMSVLAMLLLTARSLWEGINALL